MLLIVGCYVVELFDVEVCLMCWFECVGCLNCVIEFLLIDDEVVEW